MRSTWARGHERLVIGAALSLFVGVAAWNNALAWHDGDHPLRVALAVSWAAGLVLAIAIQIVRWRQGRPLIRGPEQRALERRRASARGGRYLWPAVGLALALGIFGGDVVAVLLGAFGALLLGFAPLALYVAFVVRPAGPRST